MIFVTAGLPAPVSVECGVGGFCILQEGTPRFTQTGEPATAVANGGSFIIFLYCFFGNIF